MVTDGVLQLHEGTTSFPVPAENRAGYNGGCMYAELYIATRIRDSLFLRNEASRNGGAIHGTRTVNLTARDTTFDRNTAITRYGGAISYCGGVELVRCRLANNSAGFRGGEPQSPRPSVALRVATSVWLTRANGYRPHACFASTVLDCNTQCNALCV